MKNKSVRQASHWI